MLYGDSATCRQGVGQGDRKENHLVGVYMRGNLPGIGTGNGNGYIFSKRLHETV